MLRRYRGQFGTIETVARLERQPRDPRPVRPYLPSRVERRVCGLRVLVDQLTAAQRFWILDQLMLPRVTLGAYGQQVVPQKRRRVQPVGN